MTKHLETLWEIKPHTQAKHDILRRYLGAWFGILGQSSIGQPHPGVMYLDGFCGPGRYKGGEDGSPLIALKEAMNHAQKLNSTKFDFFFIDENPKYIDHLQQEISFLQKPPNFSLHIENGEFQQVIQNELDQLAKKKSSFPPTFAFIDPFGFKGIPFSLVSKLLQNPHTEVFINVMIDAINRFLDHPDMQTQQHIIDLFGTDDVLRVLDSTDNRLNALRRLYFLQLKKHARYVRFFEMRNERDRLIYYLFFASNHSLGHVKMKEVFWKVDPLSGFTFSDATNPNQMVLLDLDPAQELLKILLASYKLKTIPVEQIKTFVQDETPYTESQMKKALGLLEKDGGICVKPFQADGKIRRKNTFPDNAVIQFIKK